MSKKVLDFMASLFFCFDVDWDSDFADDEYCLEKTEAAAPKRILELDPRKDMPRAS